MYCLLLSASMYLAAQTAESAAMVLTAKGMTTFERGKQPAQRLGAMILLRVGDRVYVPEKGEVILVFLQDGHQERLKPEAKATIHAKGCQPADAVEKVAGPRLTAPNLESLRGLVHSSRGAVGVLRGENPPLPQVVTPLYGATLMTDRPTLTWPDVGAEAYLVQMFSGGEGKEQRRLWQAIVKETRLSYPAKEKPLAFSKKYRWRVTPLKGENASGEPIVNSKFLVLTKDEIALLANLKPLVQSKSAADLLLAAVSYEAHGVYDEALRLYERLAELSPDEPNFHIALASYYDRAGRKDLAQKARAQAKKLGAES